MGATLHKALLRQLIKTNLAENTLPWDIKQWDEFLERINKYYTEADQERYLLERAMELSSKEMQDLNTKLEEAQHLATLGYWYHTKDEKENIWSRELYKMFKLDMAQPAPTIAEIFKLIHPDDLPKIKKNVSRAFEFGENYEAEIKMKTFEDNDHYRWYHVIAHPKVETDKTIKRLSGVLIDIDARKIAEQSVTSLQQKLVLSARRAGMADVATSILHNVGNVLNSMNVSIHLISEYMDSLDFNKLLDAENMLIEHKNDLNEFLALHEKGKLIPTYLVKYTNKLKNQFNQISTELKNLVPHLDHLKAITEMQKNISGISGVIENIYLPEVIDIALSMSGNPCKNNGITLVKTFNKTPFIETDKSKLLQILVNLIQNAKDAINLNNKPSRQIEISIDGVDNNKIQIQVSDNGIGIDKTNLIKIFGFGFTTKKNGHGFGLHSSALVANEMGGKLEASSEGNGKGATFTLTLPLSITSKGSNNE